MNQQWGVTKMTHDGICTGCLRQVEPAVTHARVTGSVGATYGEVIGSEGHSATVVRVLFAVEQSD